MTSNIPGHDSVLRELETLKRAVRNQGLALGALVAVVVGCVLAGLGQQTGQDELRARRLVIVDNQGKERFVVSGDKKGKADWILYDSDGKPRVIAKADDSGQAGLMLLDADRKVRMLAATNTPGKNNDDSAGLWLYDSADKLRMTIKSSQAGDAGIGAFDRDDQLRASLVVGKEGSLLLPITDLRPKKRQ